jgi:hypothetical protein
MGAINSSQSDFMGVYCSCLTAKSGVFITYKYLAGFSPEINLGDKKKNLN